MTSPTPAPAPPAADAVYGNPSAPVGLRIATGGAGQSGLLQALAEAFIASQGEDFSAEWYTSHTSISFEYLRLGVVDVAITYHAVSELAAVEAGTVDRVEYAWRDHWMLVGPKNNPAKLPTDGKSSIYSLLTKLVGAIERAQSAPDSIKFLSRYDKSACNIAESAFWSKIGHTPWAEPPSSWYHKLHALPFEAIRTATQLGEYTLTDYGTWCAVGPEVWDKMMVFAQGGNEETDPLLNPAHLLVAASAKNRARAVAFADWMIREDGGQKVIETFTKNGRVLYVAAPKGVDPLGRARELLSRPL